MSDTIRLPGGEHVPIQDTVCDCRHWHAEHAGVCCAPGCGCLGFLADPRASTPQAIAARGGDPDRWPEHAKRHAQEWARLELARVGVSGDDTTEAMLRRRLIRGETSADDLAASLSGRPAAQLDAIEASGLDG